jgi:hypothetical protein
MRLNSFVCLLLLLLVPLPIFAVDDQAIEKKLIQWGKLAESIEKNGCKKPNLIISEPIINTHDSNVIDQLQTFHCTDWQITYYIAAERTILQSIVLTSMRPRLPNGIKLGMPKESVTKILGTPQETSGNFIYYWLPEHEAGGNDSLEFMFDKNKLSQISWKYFID